MRTSMSPAVVDPADVRDRAAADAEAIVRDFLGEPNHRLSTKQDLRWGRKGSFTLRLSTGKWHDFETGEHGDIADLVCREEHCDQSSAFQWLLRWLGEVATRPRPQREQQPIRTAKEEAPRTERLAEAEALWREAKPLLGSPAEGYLIRRLGGADIPHPVVRSAQLRFHPMPYSRIRREGPVRDETGREAVGALVARMVDPATVAATAALGSAAGGFVGIHRTFLDAEFCKIEKRMLAGSGVCMIVHRPHGPLAIAEGIENVARILDVLGWDGPSGRRWVSGNMAKFPLIGNVPGITIFADNDLPRRNDRRPGNNAAMACADPGKMLGARRWF